MKSIKCRVDRVHYLKAGGLTVKFDQIIVGNSTIISFYLEGKHVASTFSDDYKLKCTLPYSQANFYMEYTLEAIYRGAGINVNK